MQNSNEKPFEGRAFYLDLRHVPARKAELVDGIKRLGGVSCISSFMRTCINSSFNLQKVEEFLQGKVSVKNFYVITDKPEKDWPPKLVPPEAGSGNAPDVHDHVSNSSINLSCNAQGQPYMQHAAPPVELSFVNQQSRAGRMLAKAGAAVPAITTNVQTSAISILNTLGTPYKQTTDVLELARVRGLKLVSADKMKMFLDGRKRDRLAVENESPSKKSIKVVPFDDLFVKVEATDQRYRPFFKVLQSWPDINFESNSGSPFAPPRLPTALLSRMTVNNSHNLEGLAVKQTEKKTPSGEQVPLSAARLQTTAGNSKTTINNAFRPTPVLTTTPKLANRSLVTLKKSQTKRKQPQYCELCNLEFELINEASLVCQLQSRFLSLHPLSLVLKTDRPLLAFA